MAVMTFRVNPGRWLWQFQFHKSHDFMN